MRPPLKGHRRGFSLGELLVSLGIVTILISLAVPGLRTSRSTALLSATRSNARQMLIGVQSYANNYKDLAPVLASPSWPEDPVYRFDFGEVRWPWFSHDTLYSIAILSYLDSWKVGVVPGNAEPPRLLVHGGASVVLSEFHLSHTLYANPDFFDLNTMSGLAQFRAQQLTSISFPSDKGLIYPATMYAYPQFGPVVTCCSVDVATPVAFADGSVSDHVLRRMPRGVFNRFAGDRALPHVDIEALGGTPIADTKRGIAGRDRQ